MTRLLLVTNPSSGKEGKGLQGVLAEAGDVGVVAPASLDSFDEEVGAAARDAELVVVAGGDGTFNCTVNALRSELGRLSFGLVPMGTGNDLARTLALPTEPLDAARAIVRGDRRSLDVCRASGPGVERLFVNACMGGFPVEVDAAIEGDLKRRIGPLAFWIGGARAATELQRATVTIDGIEVADCVAAGVGNGRTCGGGLCVWPSAVPDDGVLEGCALPASGHAAALRLAARVRSCTHTELEEVRTTRGARIEITSDPPIEFNVDGELIGLKTPATFEVVDRLRVVVPGTE